MKAYILQIGEGSGDEMTKVAYSEELFADSLGEAVDKAKALARTRPVHLGEDTIHLRDEMQTTHRVVWARSVDEVRDA